MTTASRDTAGIVLLLGLKGWRQEARNAFQQSFSGKKTAREESAWPKGAIHPETSFLQNTLGEVHLSLFPPKGFSRPGPQEIHEIQDRLTRSRVLINVRQVSSHPLGK